MPTTPDIYSGETGDGKFNIIGDSNDERSRLLSNFSNTPLFLGNEYFASVEGFIQGIKYHGDCTERWRAFMSVGIRAKKMSPLVAQTFVWWQAKQIPYGGHDHAKLITKALNNKFMQNKDCCDALIATGALVLTHDTGMPESPHTSLPSVVFCNFLTQLRKRLRKV